MKSKVYCVIGGEYEYYENFFIKTLSQAGYEVEPLYIKFYYDEETVNIINSLREDDIIICNNCEKNLMEYLKKRKLLIAYNALIYHEFNLASDRMTLIQIMISYKVWKAIKIILVKIRNALIGLNLPSYDVLITKRIALESMKKKITWKKLILIEEEIKEKSKLNKIEYIYIIDSAEDSHSDADRDEMREVSSNSYVNKINKFIRQLEKSYDKVKIIFLVHPRRRDTTNLQNISAFISSYTNEVVIGRIKADKSLIYSGPSHLGIKLLKEGYEVRFFSLFKKNITHYFLENSDFQFEK
jgi:hypothetical protein